MFNISRSRVETMSMIHEKLYKTTDIGNIDLGNYLLDLSHNILKSQLTDCNDINLDFKNDTILLGIDTAIPCGLIINELLLNILKYSFDNNQNKKITFLVKESDGQIHIDIYDNGKGISQIENFSSPDSLGFQLIGMLVKQLEGQMTITIEEGTHFCLTFRELIYKERI